MKIFALADLHLALSVPNKDMSIFGPKWQDYMSKIERHWRDEVKAEDWVLIAGDITWAMHPEEAAIDLAFIDRLPGRKVICRGNHDYWWPSKAKLHQLLPSSIHSAEHELVELAEGLAVVGTRLWDSSEYSFESIIDWQPVDKPQKEKPPKDPLESATLFERELIRLENALKLFLPKHKRRLVMVHYPPIGLDLEPSRVSRLLEQYQVELCTFGHLHSLLRSASLFGEARGVRYVFSAGDWLDFHPLPLFELN